MTDQFDIPVLFIVFNRPDLTAIVLERIRLIKPNRLFIASDGARDDVPADRDKVAEVRRIAEQVDWPCTVSRLDHQANRGCMRAVSEAITWFFDHVDRGIIIEDDCLPDPSFFTYCRELLDLYADDERVMHIGGTNPLPPHLLEDSYYFSKYNRIWGWATWRRAWRHFDIALSFWPAAKAKGAHLPHFPLDLEREFWESRWDDICTGAQDSWDHQWFLCRLLLGMAIVPMANLVSNLGFRPDAVHTKDPHSDLARRPCFPLPERLVHPASLAVNDALDRQFFETSVRSRIEAARNR